MALADIMADLRRFEGCQLEAYWDPIGQCWTIGDGHTGPEVHQGLVWTQAQADAQLTADIDAHVEQLDADPATHGWWRTLDDARQDAMIELSFNMGERTLDAFVHTLALLRAGLYAQAGAALLQSKWETEVHATRADFVAALIETGQRPAATA